MIYPIEMFACKCDNCGREWDNGDGISAYFGAEEIRYSIECSEWHIRDDKKTYCPDCFLIDDNDSIVILNTNNT